jgi:hypothetical protein
MRTFLKMVNHSLALYWKAARLTPFLSLQDDDLSGSFCLIPSGPEPSSSTLKKENISLKTELASMKSRLEATERILKLRKEQDLQLRDSIFMATREVILIRMNIVSFFSFTRSHTFVGTAGLGRICLATTAARRTRLQQPQHQRSSSSYSRNEHWTRSPICTAGKRARR